MEWNGMIDPLSWVSRYLWYSNFVDHKKEREEEEGRTKRRRRRRRRRRSALPNTYRHRHRHRDRLSSSSAPFLHTERDPFFTPSSDDNTYLTDGYGRSQLCSFLPYHSSSNYIMRVLTISFIHNSDILNSYPISNLLASMNLSMIVNRMLRSNFWLLTPLFSSV